MLLPFCFAGADAVLELVQALLVLSRRADAGAGSVFCFEGAGDVLVQALAVDRGLVVRVLPCWW